MRNAGLIVKQPKRASVDARPPGLGRGLATAAASAYTTATLMERPSLGHRLVADRAPPSAGLPVAATDDARRAPGGARHRAARRMVSHSPAAALQAIEAAPSARRASPSARGRSRRRTTRGGRWERAAGIGLRGKHVMATQPERDCGSVRMRSVITARTHGAHTSRTIRLTAELRSLHPWGN